MNRVDIIESLERRTLFNALHFSRPVSFPTGSNPAQVVTADLNSDGKTDVITADFGSANVAVLMGNGDGTFQPPVFYPVGSSPESIVIGDLNGDGIPDIVTANEASNTVSILMGIGGGVFASQVTYPVGVFPTSVALADLNGDGHLDILSTSEKLNSIAVLMNNGDGTFGATTLYAAGYQPVSLAVGDMNLDGHPDVVVTNPDINLVHVLLNTGAGAFAAPVAYAAGDAPRSVAIVDINSDARPDVITANANGVSVTILDGNGNGTLQAPVSYGVGNRPMSVTVADVNGDARPDLVTANLIDNTVGVEQRTGIAGIAPVRFFPTGKSPVSAAVADFNGDAKPDVVTANFDSSTISVLLNQTVFVPLVPTLTTASPGQPVVEVGNRLTLTAQIAQLGTSRRIATGVVQFFDGTSVIGIAHVNRAGFARLNTHNLLVGTHSIIAHYGGDSTFAGSYATPVSVVVVTPQDATTFIQPSIASVRLPSAYLPGTRGKVIVSLYEAGSGPAIGTVAVQLYFSASKVFDASAIPLVLQGRGQVRLRLVGGRAINVPIAFRVPPSIVPGNYTFFAVLEPVIGLIGSQISAAPAIGLTSQLAVAPG